MKDLDISPQDALPIHRESPSPYLEAKVALGEWAYLDRALVFEIPAGHVLNKVLDGKGVGYVVFDGIKRRDIAIRNCLDYRVSVIELGDALFSDRDVTLDRCVDYYGPYFGF